MKVLGFESTLACEATSKALSDGSSPVQSLEPAIRRGPFASAAIFSLLVFGSLFLFLPCIANHRDVADFLERQNAIATLGPRFEKYLYSSADPSLVLMSSSTGFLPCWSSDVAAKAVTEPKDVIGIYRWVRNYELPSLLLMTLAQSGLENVSAMHVGIPTASMTDNLLMLKKLYAAGKCPKLVIYCMNTREVAYVPAPGFENGGSHIENLFKDIRFPVGIRPLPRFLKFVCATARWSVLERNWTNQRYFFASTINWLGRHIWCVKKLVGSCDLVTHIGGIKPANKFLLANFTTPTSFVQDSTFYSHLFATRKQSYVDSQFEALETAAALCRSHGTKLLCVEVPWYPTVDETVAFKQEYKSRIDRLCRISGAYYYRPANDLAFSYGDFLEPVHMNAIGGEKYFWLMGKFIAKHRAELLR